MSVIVSMTGLEKTEQKLQYLYLVIQCYSCGQLLIAKKGQKSKLCTYCNTRLTVFRAKTLAKTSTASIASEAVKTLKKAQRHSMENSGVSIKEDLP